MMGIMLMVGVNDVQGEVFYFFDVCLVMQDVQKCNFGMVGIWLIVCDLLGGINLFLEFYGLIKEQVLKYVFSEIFVLFIK